MLNKALIQLAMLAFTIMALAVPFSRYIHWLFSQNATAFEKIFLKILGSKAEAQQEWKSYAASVLTFNVLGGLFLMCLLMGQGYLPWNPQNLEGVPFHLAFNISAAFITNTDWQSYSGEVTLSYLSQMIGLTAQNYLSAATGLAVAFAVVRGFIRKEDPKLGNFYADVTRATLFMLLPLAVIFSLFLIWQGVPQNFSPAVQAITLEGGQQTIPQGPVASQIAIKMLGSNGGGFFGANGAHPYENPTPLSNFAQIIAILLLPISLVLAFGRMVGDKRQSWALFVSMSFLFITSLAICAYSEQTTHPYLAPLNVNQVVSDINPGGNMEGKETRFGVFDSALWSTATTATSSGAVNSRLDSYMPMGGLAPLFNMLIGEVVYGGIGCGLYGIIIYALIAVFIAGLMVGRTPEYLGKKIEADEIRLAMGAMLVYPVCVLGFGALSLILPSGLESITAYGSHGLSQVLYAYASATANNGSAFAGFNSDTAYQNIALGAVMLIGRFGIIIPALAIAGSLAAKKIVPSSSGSLPTHGALFAVLLTGIIVMFGGLTYFPVLALGPIAEHLSIFAQ